MNSTKHVARQAETGNWNNLCESDCLLLYTVEPLITDPPRSGQPPNSGHYYDASDNPVWETRKFKLYGDDSHSQSSTGDLGDYTGIEGHRGKFMCQEGKPDTGGHSSYIGMNVCCSACENGCMVDVAHATAAD